jgi:hypothetical protein
MNTGAHYARADLGNDADFHEFPKKRETAKSYTQSALE